MKKIQVSWKQLVATLLIITMFSTSVSLEAFATENTNVQKSEETALDEADSQADEGEYQIDKADIIQSELTTDSTTYRVDEDKKVTEYYSQDVRFEDEDGKLVDYDPTLIKVQETETGQGASLESYAYENKAGDKKQYFPEELTEETPILMEYGKYQIRLAPAEIEEERSGDETVVAEETAEVTDIEQPTMENAAEDITDNTVVETSVIVTEPIEVEKETITDIYENEKTIPLKAVYSSPDEKVTFQYTSTDIGVKEEIVLEEIPGTNVFTSIIEIPGLTIRENATDEGLTIYDGDDIVAGIMAPNMNDATGEAYSESATYDLAVIDEEAGKYQLILTVDEKYLKDEERQYPVTIDPTISWSGNSKVSDVYVLSGSDYKALNFYDSGVTAFHAGKVSQGISRTYLAFASISSLYGRYVESAKLVLTEAGSSDASQTVNAYRVTKSWSKSTVTWNNKPSYNTTVLSSIKTKGTTYTKYTLNLTTLFRGYAKKSYSNYGILLKNPTETGKHGRFFGSRHATSSYRPKLTIVHYDPPTVPATVGVASQYVKKGNTVTAKWTGITSQSLSYVQYRLAKYDHSTKKETSAVTAYSSSTKLGTASSGSAAISASSSWADGSYKLAVRGVDSSGIAGTEKAAYVYIDGTPPTGTIKVVKPGDATAEVTTLQDTVQIIANVDGTITPIANSSMALYDSEGNFVEDIYTNSTLSTIENMYTPEHPNGKYVLKLEMADKAGNTATVTKDIEIVNKLASPVLHSVKSNQSIVQIPWEFKDPSGPVCGVAYKVAGSEEWTKVPAEDTTKTSGTLEVTLPEGEGIYEVSVCGIDAAGSLGAEAVVECTIDKTAPTVEISEFDRGLLCGTITDTYLDNWKVYLKKEGEVISEEDTTVLEGTSQIEDGDIGVIDISELEIGVPYVLTLVAADEAGNEKRATTGVIRTADDILIERNVDGFFVKRPTHTGHTKNHIVLPQNQTQVELQEYPMIGSIPEGDVYWYCNNQKVSEEDNWTIDVTKEEGVIRSILAVIKGTDGTYYYSRNRINNRKVLPVIEGTAIELPEGSVSFRLNTGGENVSVLASVDGAETVTVVSGQTYHISELTAHEKACAETITITTDGTLAIDGWTLETDCITPETFEFSEMANYHPQEISVVDKLNYKTYLKWEGVEGEWPEDISYEIYRGLEEDFTPSEKTLIASDIKANYWVEMNINYSKTFYYRVRAVKKDESGNVVKADDCSYEVDSRVVAADEYIKRMGVKEYWEYAEFETPSGDGYIEKSRGNLVYIQADAALPNEQLPVTLERTYNSQSTAKTAFGVGWTHSFDMELLSNCKDDQLDFQNIVFKDGNGTLYFFDWNEDTKEYVSSMGKYVNLVKEDKTETVKLPEKTIGVSDQKKEVAVTSAFTMTTKDNVEYRFNSGGQLVYMAEANGNFLLFEYETNKGLLSKVTTSRNLSIEFVYHTDADYTGEGKRPDLLTVKEILLPDGSKMAYQYEDSRLSGVTQVGTDETSRIHWSMDYNEEGIMTTVTDALANLYTISYSGQKTETVTYPNGDAIKLVYDTENDQTKTYKVVTEDGVATDILLETNTFEAASGNSLNMTDSYGNSVDYEYQDKLLSKTFYSTTYQTIEDGKITEHQVNKDQSEMSSSNSYDSRENLTAETDEDGITTTYEYGNPEGPLKDLPTRRIEKDKEGATISDETYEYDDYGNVKKTYDAIGDITTITKYHEKDDTSAGTLKGEVAEETEYIGENQHNKVTTTYNYSYDEKGNKTEIMTETSGSYTVTTTTVYDVMGREISSTDTHGTTTATEYDAFGRIIKITITQGAGAGAITDEVTRTYDDNGTLVRETESDGTVYTYAYDNMNRVVAESIQKDGKISTWTTSYSYGSVEINTGKGKETVDHVLITEETNPDNDLLAVTYVDTLGRTVREKANGLYTDYVYDREGKVTFRCSLGTDPENTDPVITAYLYDEYGNNTSQILNPVYDAETDAFLVTDESISQSMTYDSTGNVLSATDAMGNTTSYQYDVNGRVTKVIQPKNTTGDANETTVVYDVKNSDGTTSDIITDALQRTSATTYNSLMQPVSVADKGDGKEGTTAIQSGYSYNAKGLLEKETTSKGTSVKYEYDAKDRVIAIHYLDSKGAEELRTCYTYDKSDNVTTMLDYKVSGTTATLYRYTGFTYDRLKRLTELVEMNTDTVPTAEEQAPYKTVYKYDIDGNLTKVTYPTNNDWNVKGLAYIYNEDKWLTEIKILDGTNEEGETLRTYSYNNYGDVSEIKDYRVLSEDGSIVENPGYTICTYTYDKYLRPVSMTYADSGEPSVVKESYTYVYDKNSNIIKETLYNNYPTAVEDKQNEERIYNYDTDGKLLSMTVTDKLNETESYTVSYTYDKVGNRLTQEKEMASGADTETTAYEYNSLNQLLSSKTTNSEGTVTEQKNYLYDANGSQTKETDSISNTVIESGYDLAGRLASYKKTEKNTVTVTQTNQYNGAGARIKKTEGEEVTNYFYSQGGVLYTEDGTGAGTSLNLSGISGNIIATARDEAGTEGYYYYHKDAAGSTTNLRNAAGESIVSYKYTDFGGTTIGGNEDFYNEICYNGGVYDKSTGLYYLNARYYDPSEGRFISRDSYRGSLSNPSTLHLYAYCANNPVTYSDPSGHVAISRIIGGIVGGGVGAYVGSKIAKKTKATGWKKVAIIAGCTIAGAVVGAIAGPKVAKVAKKAAKVVKKKVKSVAKKLKSTKKTAKKVKVNSASVKSTSKTKKVIVNKMSTKAVTKKVIKKAIRATADGAMEGTINILSDTSTNKKTNTYRKGFENGFARSLISSSIREPKGSAVAGAAVSLMNSIRDDENLQRTVGGMVLNGGIQGGMAAMSKFVGTTKILDELSESNSLVDKVAGESIRWMNQIYGVGVDVGIRLIRKQ